MRDDFALLDAWSEGDRAAADELFSRHFDALLRFFSLKASDAVEDLVQDTFLACVKNRNAFRRDGSFKAYLFGTARRLLFKHYRRNQRGRVADDIGASSLADLDPSPSSVVGHKREHRLLLEALRRIPLDYQITLELYEWEGLDGKEVAEVLGITEAAMRSRLHRARQALRTAVSEIEAEDGVLESTMQGLDGWAKSLRAQLGRDAEPEP